MGYMGNELYATKVASPLFGAVVSTADELRGVSLYATKVASPVVFGAETLVADKYTNKCINATEVASPINHGSMAKKGIKKVDTL
jgi:hypothetical protein